MPICPTSRHNSGERVGRVRTKPKCRTSDSASKLGASDSLIAPAHSLTLPTLAGVKERVEISRGFDAALPPARALAKRGLLTQQHLAGADSVAGSLEKSLIGIIERAVQSVASQDRFGIEIQLTDRLEYGEGARGYLFFVWRTNDPNEYIPLYPVYKRLNGHPQRERLMASLYVWLYEAASKIVDVFGLDDAEYYYHWRKDAYMDAREAGEDVDIEGEVEFADPSKIVNYIRRSKQMKFGRRDSEQAIASIPIDDLREAFAKAYRLFLLSRTIQIPRTDGEYQQALKEAMYYLDGEPMPALGISHSRDDAIVARLDEVVNEQFNSGVSSRPFIVLCFRPDDAKQFLRIVEDLPRMVQVAHGLSEWVRFAQEMENAGNNTDRR